MRERAAELVDLDLGPPSIDDIRARLRGEVNQERLTSIDRALLRDADAAGLVAAKGRDAFEQTIRTGRLRRLERFGLARPVAAGRWRLAPDLADTLKHMGERGDIIRTMQRAFAAQGKAPALADQIIYDAQAPGVRPLVGRLLERGLADELDDRHYLILEGADGRSHYVDIGGGEGVEPQVRAAIIRIAPVSAGIREVDRTVAEVAAANGGRYTIDVHLRHDPGATHAFAESHVRRLEAMRRLTGGATREPDGSWIIAPDHLDRAAAFEARRAKDRPVIVETLSAQPLEKLVGAEAATWLDRELVALDPEPLRDAGFGQEARHALAQRRQWLLEEGLAVDRDGTTTYRPGMIDALRRRELLRVAGQLSDELGLPFVEPSPGARIAGRLRGPVDLMSGRFALIENSREFMLAPWRPVLERYVGQSLTGVQRPDGISWTFGRERGPSVS
jgi:hypothetical protein